VVSGAKGSARWPLDLPASASGAMIGISLERAAGEIAVEETVLAACRFRFRGFKNLLVHGRQRAGRIGIAGISCQRKGLAAAAAKIDFLEFARSAWLGHPAGSAI